MDERGGLENRCGRQVTVGSNPTLSEDCIKTEYRQRHAVGSPSSRSVGEVTEWPKVHDWKSCVAQNATVGSNPTLSASIEGCVGQ